jgi:hypothetical protein
MPARVVGHVDHPIAGLGAGAQDGGDAGHGHPTAVHDAVEVDQQQHAPMLGHAL